MFHCTPLEGLASSNCRSGSRKPKLLCACAKHSFLQVSLIARANRKELSWWPDLERPRGHDSPPESPGGKAHLLPSTYLARHRHLTSLLLVSWNQPPLAFFPIQPEISSSRKFKISQFSSGPGLPDKSRLDHESPDVIIMKCKNLIHSVQHIVLFVKWWT